MRRVVQEGQKPRPLQEKATSNSSPHEVQRTRAKPRRQDHEPGQTDGRSRVPDTNEPSSDGVCPFAAAWSPTTTT